MVIASRWVCGEFRGGDSGKNVNSHKCVLLPWVGILLKKIFNIKALRKAAYPY